MKRSFLFLDLMGVGGALPLDVVQLFQRGVAAALCLHLQILQVQALFSQRHNLSHRSQVTLSSRTYKRHAIQSADGQDNKNPRFSTET